jgi:hypothetical protein
VPTRHFDCTPELISGRVPFLQHRDHSKSRILKRNWGPVAAIVLVAAMFVWVKSARSATDHYVSVSGSGTLCTFAAPCNLDTGVCAVGASTRCSGGGKPAPGDTVWMRGGTYPSMTISSNGSGIGVSGTAAAPITLRNYQDGTPYGEHVIFDGSLNAKGSRGSINLWVASHWIIRGIDFNNLATSSRNYPSGTPTDRAAAIAGGWSDISVINCFAHNNAQGFQRSTGNTSSDSGATYYGNIAYYNGYDWVAQGRGAGHEFYLQNTGDFGATTSTTNLPVVSTDNIAASDFYQGWHDYTEGGQIMRMQSIGNAITGSGRLSQLTPSLVGEQVTGANGAAAGSCTGSTKMLYQPIFSGNLTYGKTGEGFAQQLGYLKGACDATVTNNYYAAPGGTSIMLGPTYSNGTLTGCSSTVVNGVCMNGNTFIGATGGFAQSDYPTNTYLASKPTSGKFYSYHPNRYDAGRGWVAVYNWDHDATLPIDPAQLGAYSGEHYKVCHYLDPIPWTCTAITSGTWTSGTITVATSGLNIEQPGGAGVGGIGLWPKPTETGTEFNIYILYDTGGGSPTPTPTTMASRSPSSISFGPDTQEIPAADPGGSR